VPAEGVDARFYTHAEIMAALDGVEGTARATLDDEPINALIITGAQHPAHVWQDTTPALQEALEQDPRVAVTVSEDIECLKDDLSSYDLIVLNYCNWQQPPLSEESKQGFIEYLNGGGGLVLIHFSNGAFHFSLPDTEASDWPEYRNICRRVWDHTPGLSGHDAYGEFDVEVIDQEHEITQGLETFRTKDELYFRQQGDHPIHVLAEARSQVTGEWEPMAFVYDYGEGRIFQTVLGHAAESIRNEGTSELISRAAAWVAKREPLEPGRRVRPIGEGTTSVEPLVEGRFGTALNATAAGAYVTMDEVFRHPPLTVECWAKLDNANGFNILIAHENKDSATHWELFTQAGDGHLAAYLPGMSPDHARSNVNVCDGAWHHLAMTYEANRVRLYIDGTQVADQPMERASDATVPAALAIGRLVDGGIGCTGVIDEVRISRGVRDVASVPTEPFAVDDDTLGLWRFDAVMPSNADGSGTLFADESGQHPAVFGQNAGVLDGDSVSDNGAADPTKPDHWGREVVGFDWTEDDSRDSRWQEMDVGPSLASIVDLPGGLLAKGLTIRLQDGESTASVCYDTATMQMRAAWTGGFLQFDPARYGIIVAPKPQGEPLFVAEPGTAWPEHEVKYQGYYRHGERIVLAYTVDGVRVLESPWLLRSDEGEVAVVRTFEVAPHAEKLTFLAPTYPAIRVVGAAGWAFNQVNAVIAPSEGREFVHVLIAPAQTSVDQLAAWQAELGDDFEFNSLTTGGPALWNQTLETIGSLGTDQGPYAVDTLTLPFDNPWKALMFVGGHDFFSNGDAAVCTLHGDVWRVSGIDADLDRIVWTRMASGLFQPLGLRIVNNQVYVLGRDRITRLHDLNDDGEADFYESFHDGITTSAGGHDYVTCLETDSQGNFYYVHAIDGVVRVSADGLTSEVVATGLRNPNGMSVGPNDVITATPQEGEWTPASYLCWVLPGDHYGYLGPRVTDSRPLGFDPPMIYFPRLTDNSSGGQVWVPPSGFGSRPAGEMLHLSFGQCTLHSILYEPAFGNPSDGIGANDTTVVGRRQAGSFVWPIAFESGAMRGRFHPLDGMLYVSGMRGWVTSAAQDGCLQRVRPTGKPDPMPIASRSYGNGLMLQFPVALDAETAQDVGRYRVERWDYQYRAEYGSPDLLPGRESGEGHETVSPRSATLLEPTKLFLEIPEMKPVNQLEVELSIRTADGEPLRFTYLHTLNYVPEERIDESRLSRTEPQLVLDAALQARLRRGLVAEIRDLGSEEANHCVVSRMANWQLTNDEFSRQTMGQPKLIEITGWLSVDLTDEYEFRIEGADIVMARINFSITNFDEDLQRPFTLQQGFNEIAIAFLARPEAGCAFRLLWRGPNFDWEPLPPDRLWHDPETPALVEATQLREGRTLFAELKCFRCHGDPSGSLSEWDLARSGPDLRGIGERVQHDWIAGWLADPAGQGGHVTMPHLLSDDPAVAHRDASDLAAFLVTLAGDATAVTEAVAGKSADDIEAGLQLYENLSCIACHHFEPPQVIDEYDRISLFHVNQKYPPGSLAAFLSEPGRHHASTRMPDFNLTPEQAAQLAAYVVDSVPECDTPHGDPPGDGPRGRELFTSLRCAACHAVPAEAGIETPASIALMPTFDMADACFTADDVNAGHEQPQPRYAVTPMQGDALLAFLLNADQFQAPEPPAEFASRVMETLRCSACHDRDGERAPRFLILAEESETGLTPEIYPSLTWTGERVDTDWLAKFLNDHDRKPLRPWIHGRMPHWNVPGDVLAQGLADQHATSAISAAATEEIDPDAIAIGERLTLNTALDCRQCHAMQGRDPLGDERTLFARGLDFELIAERTRHDFFERYVLNPPRFDANVRMPVLSADGQTTKVTDILEGDADRQFDAVWAFIQSLRQ
jgi:type 1 glutamine amidotransferase/mono/diheme cytochrome c family protein